MDWDFVIAMAVVGMAAIWLLYRFLRTAKTMRDVGLDKAAPEDLCKSCPFHEKCGVLPQKNTKKTGSRM